MFTYSPYLPHDFVFAEPDGLEARYASEAHRQLQRSLGLYRGEGAGGGPAARIIGIGTTCRAAGERGAGALPPRRVAVERFLVT